MIESWDAEQQLRIERGGVAMRDADLRIQAAPRDRIDR